MLVFLGLYVWGKIYAIEKPLVKAERIADTTRIYQDLWYLTKHCQYRNYLHIDSLNKSADYIRQRFSEISNRIEIQKYNFRTIEFKNIICSLGPADGERIIIGAHYDVCNDQEGADDNASGICGLIELARILKNENLKYRIDFVAYSLEEPPFFKSEYMGSYIHAKSLFDNKIKIKGMICLEMLGFYREEAHTQSYPAFFLRWFYGNKANYITVVQKYGNGEFGKFISKRMKTDQVIRTKSFSGPLWLPGVDFSDHLNYWKFGYSGVMITNTSFYRNPNYHQKGDRLETLNVGNIGLVVDELYRTIKEVK
jgi:hypothetical protein